MTIFGKEPALAIGTIVTIIVAVITTLSGNGYISEAAAGQSIDAVNALQQTAIVFLPLITAIITRGQVYSPATVQTVANNAAASGSPVVTVTPP